jgi:uncharacterized protein (DUF1330 family)
MAAYVIADVDITDAERYPDYTKHVPDSIAGYGGRFLARGGAFEVLEGEWQPGRVVVIEFPTMEAALNWFRSDDYQELAEIRREASTAKILAVEGV